MFGKELNRSNVCNLSQVTMIESKCERPDSSFRKKVNMPATVFTKSPMRDRQNKSIVGNTPTRKNQLSRVAMGAAEDQTRRSSISPLKNKRQQLGVQQPGNSFMEQNSSYYQTQPAPTGYNPARQAQLSNSIHSQVSKSRKVEACQNHNAKPAKFYASVDDQELPYCEKCAILLASQGFKVARMEDFVEQQESAGNTSTQLFSQVSQQAQQPSLLDDHTHPRRQEIGSFLSELDFIMQALQARRADVHEAAQRTEGQFQQQNAKVGAFYQGIIDQLMSHKGSVDAALAQQHSQLMGGFASRMETVEQAITDSRTMKEDILSSLDLIKEAEEKDYRPILESYKENARKFKQISQKIPLKGDFKLAFGDCSEHLRRFLKSLTAVLAGEKQAPQASLHKEASSHSSINFSFEGRTQDEQFQRHQDRSPKLSPVGMIQGKGHPGPTSEDENPIELLSQEDLSRQKFMKSSLKDHNGLFSEFDDFTV